MLKSFNCLPANPILTAHIHTCCGLSRDMKCIADRSSQGFFLKFLIRSVNTQEGNEPLKKLKTTVFLQCMGLAGRDHNLKVHEKWTPGVVASWLDERTHLQALSLPIWEKRNSISSFLTFTWRGNSLALDLTCSCFLLSRSTVHTTDTWVPESECWIQFLSKLETFPCDPSKGIFWRYEMSGTEALLILMHVVLDSLAGSAPWITGRLLSCGNMLTVFATPFPMILHLKRSVAFCHCVCKERGHLWLFPGPFSARVWQGH